MNNGLLGFGGIGPTPTPIFKPGVIDVGDVRANRFLGYLRRLTPLVSPAIVAGSVTKFENPDNVNWSTLSFSFTSTTGNVVFMGCARSGLNPSPFFQADWNGNAMTTAARAKVNGSGRCVVLAAYISGSDTGTHNLTLTADTANLRTMAGVGFDLNRMADTPLGSAPVAVSVQGSAVDNYSITTTMNDTRSLALGMVWFMNGDMYPLNVFGTGMLGFAIAHPGTGVSRPVGVAAQQSEPLPASVTLSASGATLEDDCSAVLMEFLPVAVGG